ncbi:MAG: sigma-54 dependent transcriptional regulator [Syntrophorhabdaceae bacterium]|nr:sigma-54 dependent transcriptional regulator [Syntrophorhabdaceae bacterium]MDD5242776.1 sigma-54 dependent transcriptional regulator [Syntrophorhabdaceae bacterium]
MEKILIVDDNKDMQFLLSNILKSKGYEISVAGDGRKALKEVKGMSANLVLLDIHLPDMDGIKVLEEMKRINQDLAIIMLTAYGDIKGAVQAMKLGAFEYITKPFDNDELLIAIKRVLQTQYLSKEVQSLRKQLGEKTASDLIVELTGESQRMKQVFKQIDIVSPTNLTIVLQGESGTGKELVAHLIHKKSQRSDKAFVAVDCGSIPESLVESELFGYEKGAFTGADTIKEGKFEQANGGTLFLDEITNLPDPAQAKLLRVLQEKRLEHLGGKKDIKVDVRIVAASNVDLPEALKAGRFRNDLFHRLNEFPIILPPLRERKEDIPYLVNRFLEGARKEFNKDVKGFSPEAMKTLLDYHWPGNVRELKNTVMRAALLAESENIVQPCLFQDTVSEPYSDPNNLSEQVDIMAELKKGFSLHEIAKKEIDNIERNIITQALYLTGGNKSKAAKMLGIDRMTLYARLNKHGIK